MIGPLRFLAAALLSLTSAWAGTPTVVSVASPDLDGTYFPGDTLTVNVTFSEAVVTMAGDPQQISTSIGPMPLTGGSGTSLLTYSLLIPRGATTSRLSASWIQGDIRSVSTDERLASIHLPTEGAASLPGTRWIAVDNLRVPAIWRLKAYSHGQWVTFGDEATIVLMFTEDVRTSRDCLLAVDLLGGETAYLRPGEGVFRTLYPTLLLNPSLHDVVLAPKGVRLLAGTLTDAVGIEPADLGWQPPAWNDPSLTLEASLLNPSRQPINDSPEDATPLAFGPGGMWGTTIGATPDSRTFPGAESYSDSVWYRFIPPSSMEIAIFCRGLTNAVGSQEFTSIGIQVFRKPSDPAQPLIPLSPGSFDPLNTFTFSALDGNAYLVRVSSYSPVNFEICASSSPAALEVQFTVPMADFPNQAGVLLHLTEPVMINGAFTLDLSLDGRRVTASSTTTGTAFAMFFIYMSAPGDAARRITIWPGAQMAPIGSASLTDLEGNPLTVAPLLPPESRGAETFFRPCTLGFPSFAYDFNHSLETPIEWWVGEPADWSRRVVSPGPFSASASGLPAGVELIIDEGTVRLAGVPTTGGCHEATVTLTNALGSTAVDLRLRVMPNGGAAIPDIARAPYDFYGTDRPAGALTSAGSPDGGDSDDDEGRCGSGTSLAALLIGLSLTLIVWRRR